jgi:hypothetical protein
MEWWIKCTDREADGDYRRHDDCHCLTPSCTMIVGSWRRLIAAQLLVVATAIPAPRGPSSRCEHYWPRHIALVGTLERVLRFGPPNYGESPKTDRQYSVPTLRLSRPIQMCADSVSGALSGITEVQVQVTPSRAKRLYDLRIRVFGTVGPAGMAHDFTKIVLTPDSIIVVHDTVARARRTN